MNWKLKKRITELYRTQADFAEVANVSDALVSRVIRGRRDIPDTEKHRWAKILRCPRDEIFNTNDTEEVDGKR